MLTPRQQVRRFLQSADTKSAICDIEMLGQFDRYQASAGIESAACYVAERASELGLENVTIKRFPADGAARWWSYRAPSAWTPMCGRAILVANGEPILQLDHAKGPFTLATYSRETVPGGIESPVVVVRESAAVRGSATEPGVEGCIAVLPKGSYRLSAMLDRLRRDGAKGFITDFPCRTDEEGQEFAGRIELSQGDSLFGFSVTHSELALIEKHCGQGSVYGRVTIDIDRSATMPVVTAVLPGTAEEEVWLTAHLCHPRPGANDNASGVSALLGIASLLQEQRRAAVATGGMSARTIRFVWGPEYLGVVATMWDRQVPSSERCPIAVINLDMVGEDQQRCRCPFVVERAPDFLPNLLDAVAEHFVGAVFDETSYESGAWQSAEFMGFSDHALFADPAIARPAVQLCHVNDVFNHSAADTPDKVSAVELTRAIAAGAAVAWAVSDLNPQVARWVRDIGRAWCGREKQLAAEIANRWQSVGGGNWSRRFAAHVEQRLAAIEALTDDGGADPFRAVSARRPEPAVGLRTGYRRNWEGPVDIRSMLSALSPASRRVVSALIEQSKSNYAVLLNLAIRADGAHCLQELTEKTSFGFRRPLDTKVAERLVHALIESGWLIAPDA